MLTAPEPWPGPRRAAVSAFGFGGTNAHLIVDARTSSRSGTAPRRVARPRPPHSGSRRSRTPAPTRRSRCLCRYRCRCLCRYGRGPRRSRSSRSGRASGRGGAPRTSAARCWAVSGAVLSRRSPSS
ncbi:ketoacyl-synthetase C-terminal extension domain-containing protein [Streptomyces sp. SolWspMP-sol7th]|uniref:ketoacyl-synthetase C-terminal extension domain-containing protein n=1 Tax=Streptomyces sp. SolWspMP-sol7th TaxID=1839776 RepID=UPI0020C796E1|nr:ketoacyl-synthetase C-terminal extension domain-containing protein [Streptomyces sp. SolWspMP-sol7th]